MICNFSNFQHGTCHDRHTSDVMGGIMGGGASDMTGVSQGVPIT